MSAFEAGIVALAVCLGTGGAVMVAVTVAGIIGAVAIVSAAGWLHGFWPVAVMVLGIVLGEVLADQLATRLWGQPRRSGA